MKVPLLDRRLDEIDFCIIDLETTGFSPTRDEILEIGCVRVAPDGTVVDRCASLVRPTGPVHGSEVHGIGRDDVVGAPILSELSGHVARCLDGALLVSWNVYFDYAFLRHQLFEPLGLDPDIPRMCCMYLRGLTGREPSRARLAEALAELGLPGGTAHTAYDDAMATALLLSAYLDPAPDGVETFRQLAQRGTYKFLESWSRPLARLPPGLPTAAQHPRPSAFLPDEGSAHIEPLPTPRPEVAPVGVTVDRVWAAWPAAPSEGEEAYLDCLCDALADRQLTTEDMARLGDCARFYQLDAQDVDSLHRRLLGAVLAQAERDGLVTEEAEDLARLAGLLGATQRVADAPRPSRWPLAAAAVVAVVALLLAGTAFL